MGDQGVAKLKSVVKRARGFSQPYRVTDGKRFRIRDVDPRDTGPLRDSDRPRVREAMLEGIQALSLLQDMLYAQDRWAVLLIFQAMDAAGKDGAIKHVMSGINPQGCHVVSFKAPSTVELDHDYLWRCAREVPERGRIGIFNRSYYEEVLVVRVHEELLRRQMLPPEVVNKNIWQNRFRDIRGLERYLGENGVVVRKFFLHVSRAEQKRRFLDRINQPEKNWKFAPSDVQERLHWKDYMSAYEDAIRNTATEEAPWYVVPADNKWYTRLVVGAAIIDALGSLKLHYPRVDAARLKELTRAKRALLAERS